MKKLIILTVILSAFAVSSNAAAPVFNPETGIRISSAAGAYFLPLNTGGYRVYFSTGYGIISATTTAYGLDWRIEQGFRLLASTFTNYDDNKVLNPAIFQPSATYYRMIYEGVTSKPTTSHFLLSAVSTDTINWYKETDSSGTGIIRLKALYNNDTTAYISSPYVIQPSSFQWRMYFTVSSTNNPETSSYDAIGSAVTTDGINWNPEPGFRIQARANIPVCVKLSNSNYRLYWAGSSSLGSEPVNDAILSATSSDGLAFLKETGSRISVVSGSSVTAIQAIRLPGGFNWRLFYDVWVSTMNSFELYSALADVPVITQASPILARNNEIIVIDIKGEILDSSATVKLIQNSTEISASSVTWINDMELNATFDLTGKPAGLWDLRVTNSNGKYAALNSQLEIRFPEGEAVILDNLIRVWEHVNAKINFRIFGNGNVKIKIYTLDNRFVKTLIDGNLTANSYSYTWDATDDSGKIVPSGVYVVYIEGPELKTRKKIVVVK